MPTERTNAAVHALLQAGFLWDELEWKVQATGKSSNGLWARIVPYVDTRAIISRLDTALGPANYDITLEPILTGATQGGRRSGFKASIRVQWPEGQVTVREDVSEETATEPMKGGASGAIKRAAVHYGIGAYLYSSPDFYADISENGEHRGQHIDKQTKQREFFKWSVPREAIQWVQETIGASTAPSPSSAPSSKATASPPPSRPATTAAPATHSSTSGKVMPGRDGWFKGMAGQPVEDVPVEVLQDAASYYRKKIAEKPDDRWVNKSKEDLAIIEEALAAKGEEPPVDAGPPPGWDENPFDGFGADDDDVPF